MEKYKKELSNFIGKELTQVAVGQYQIQLHFFSDISISIDRMIKGIIGGENVTCDAEDPKTSSILLNLLGLKVSSIELCKDDSLEINMEDGSNIVIVCDKSDGYESYQVVFPNDCIVF